jgi:hypothetical protein
MFGTEKAVGVFESQFVMVVLDERRDKGYSPSFAHSVL